MTELSAAHRMFRFAFHEAKVDKREGVKPEATAEVVEDFGSDPGAQDQGQGQDPDARGDDRDSPACPMCSSPGVPLGKLGSRVHYRCRNCGIDFSQDTARRESKKVESIEKPRWEPAKHNRFDRFRLSRRFSETEIARLRETIYVDPTLAACRSPDSRFILISLPHSGAARVPLEGDKVEATDTETAAQIDLWSARERIQSRGHLGYRGDSEIFERGGSIFRAEVGTAIQPDGYRRASYIAPANRKDEVLAQEVPGPSPQPAPPQQPATAAAPPTSDVTVPAAPPEAPRGWERISADGDLLQRRVNHDSGLALSKRIFSSGAMSTLTRNVWSKTKAPALHHYQHPEFGQLRISFPKKQGSGPALVQLIGRPGQGSAFADHMNSMID